MVQELWPGEVGNTCRGGGEEFDLINEMGENNYLGGDTSPLLHLLAVKIYTWKQYTMLSASTM